MVERFQDELNIVKNKLETIGFYQEYDSDYITVFGNGTSWKVDFSGERYGEATDLSIRNIDNPIMKNAGQRGLNIFMILKTFGLFKNYAKSREEVMDLFIQYKDKIFDETFPYREAYDKLNR